MLGRSLLVRQTYQYVSLPVIFFRRPAHTIAQELSFFKYVLPYLSGQWTGIE